jgi:hypothetical protein
MELGIPSSSSVSNITTKMVIVSLFLGYEVECHPKEKIKFEIQESIYIVVRANEVKDGEKIMISIYPI